MKKFEKIAPFVIVTLLVINILFAGILVSRTGITDGNINPTPTVTPTSSVSIKITTTPTTGSISASPTATSSITDTPPVPTPYRAATTLGVRTPGLIENIDLLADPPTAQETVAMIRLYVENGQVLDFQVSPGLLSAGACVDNQKFTSERVCVDLAKVSVLIAGEKLGTMTVKWGDNGMIYRETGDGYYNGQTTTLSVPGLFSNSNLAYVDHNYRGGAVAGISTSNYAIEGVILIVASAVMLFMSGIGFFINLGNNGKIPAEKFKRNERVIKISIISGLVVLTAGSFSVVKMISTGTQDTITAVNSSPDYVTVVPTGDISELPYTGDTGTATPTATLRLTPSLTPTISPVLTISPTMNPTPTTVPTITPTIVVTLTTTPSPPVPTQFADDVPLVCGPLDVNADRILNTIDYNAFAVVYNHQCSDVYPHQSCGGKDTNDDGVVNYLDFYYLVAHMYPSIVDCTRY